MAIYKVATLLSKGFTETDLQAFIDADLMHDAKGELSKYTHPRLGNRRLYQKGEMLRSHKAPSAWPKQYRAIWDAHKTY